MTTTGTAEELLSDDDINEFVLNEHLAHAKRLSKSRVFDIIEIAKERFQLQKTQNMRSFAEPNRPHKQTA